jgi:hypothetical protein
MLVRSHEKKQLFFALRSRAEGGRYRIYIRCEGTKKTGQAKNACPFSGNAEDLELHAETELDDAGTGIGGAGEIVVGGSGAAERGAAGSVGQEEVGQVEDVQEVGLELDGDLLFDSGALH